MSASLVEKLTVLCLICHIIALYLLTIITLQVSLNSVIKLGEFIVYEEVHPFLNDYVKNVTEG